jgi:predicted histone-like DNA-binding protein
MAVKYNTVARGNPSDPNAPKKYYPVVKSTGRVRQRDLAERAAEMSTLSSADLAAALEIFLAIIPRELANGNIVDLGDFGSFSLRIRGEGAETEDAFSARNITEVVAAFRPGQQFKHTLGDAKFEKA